MSSGTTPCRRPSIDSMRAACASVSTSQIQSQCSATRSPGRPRRSATCHPSTSGPAPAGAAPGRAPSRPSSADGTRRSPTHRRRRRPPPYGYGTGRARTVRPGCRPRAAAPPTGTRRTPGNCGGAGPGAPPPARCRPAVPGTGRADGPPAPRSRPGPAVRCRSSTPPPPGRRADRGCRLTPPGIRDSTRPRRTAGPAPPSRPPRRGAAARWRRQDRSSRVRWGDRRIARTAARPPRSFSRSGAAARRSAARPPGCRRARS